MEDFIAPADRPVLERHGLTDFEALWDLPLERVEEPNARKEGWSSVFRLHLDGREYFLKRQCNHQTRSLAKPFGEPTFAREFRNIRRFQELGVPAVTAAFFARRRKAEKREKAGDRAILITHALDGWRAFAHWLADWPSHPEALRADLLAACGKIAHTLLAAKMVHGCFYPKHIFLRESGGGFEARLIDLEKAHLMIWRRRDRGRDLDQFLRHAQGLSEAETGIVIAASLGCPPESAEVEDCRRWLARRWRHKE
jgi:hypothetical protein